MERLEEEYVLKICPYCHNPNEEDCSIRIFNCSNHICCKCVNFKGNLEKTEIIRQGVVNGK
mgnify:CR=1 FL=1|nr:MAG TPA: ribosomal protein L30/L37a [Caudoviricetes sp.]